MSESFNEEHVLHELKHFLPAQAPLKDFVHHNTLHAFQDFKFHEGINRASDLFGYRVYLSLKTYRSHFETGRITSEVLDNIIIDKKGENLLSTWKNKLIQKDFEQENHPRIGNVRSFWKTHYKIDLDSIVHTKLFRFLCSYLDQGISIWSFPIKGKGFLECLRELERQSYSSLFYTKKATERLYDKSVTIESLLKTLVGDSKYFKQYLFDQQFSHQGWSGMVAAVELQPETLLDSKPISLKEVILFELILELDAIDKNLGKNWRPLGETINGQVSDFFEITKLSELQEVVSIWQEAFEWSYYDEVLSGIQQPKQKAISSKKTSFQAIFCLDDRECSIRRYLERLDVNCETFGTPGFFGVEFYFQPQDGMHVTKVCPGPVTPKFLVKETASKNRREVDINFSKHAQSFHSGWVISQTLGFFSAIRLMWQMFFPKMDAGTSSSLKHMDQRGSLSIENIDLNQRQDGLQIGFALDEMAIRVENMLKSIGLVEDFAPIVYVLGHGASSINNPHYAAYDCGACSGRAGSVNARVFAYMANNKAVRAILAKNGVVIPDSTEFVGGIRDSTRDEVRFFDETDLITDNLIGHTLNAELFEKALDLNAKERSRRFESIDTNLSAHKIRNKVKLRSVSLFEPRPELNHATNALCIIARRSLSKNLFLDRRSFLNSFDYRVDPDGKYLLNILNAANPVCGGINLEYYFSRTDNQKLGAGTKLPHNVMGLFGVANGVDGDLRPGLPSQMIEVHDPVRLLMLVEHFPEVVMKTIKTNPATYQWYENEWINLIVVEPETKNLFRFVDGEFIPYVPTTFDIPIVTDLNALLESSMDNLSVHILNPSL